MNLDIYEVLKLANTKPFGFRQFRPGPGIGGHCIPIDPQYLYWKANQIGIKANFIKLSAEINVYVSDFIMKKINQTLNKIGVNKKRSKLLILGLAYKKDVDDTRESSSINLLKRLLKNDYKIIDYSDPYIKNTFFLDNLNFKKKSINLNSKNLKKYDIVILMTDHEMFDYKLIYNNSKKIIDCRGRYDVDSKVVRG